MAHIDRRPISDRLSSAAFQIHPPAEFSFSGYKMDRGGSR